MLLAKSDIILKLEREILPLEGLKILPSDRKVDLRLPSITQSLPNHKFPIGCIHEMASNHFGDTGSMIGFTSFLLGKLADKKGIIIWIASACNIYAPGLTAFGIPPENIIVIHLKSNKHILWVMEEALKCKNFAAVVAEIKEIDFKTSRRLQLAAEKSRVTGFLLRAQDNATTIASVARWHVCAAPGAQETDLPGVGFPRWKIHLSKIRNGRPGKWLLEWGPEGIHEIQNPNYGNILQLQAKSA